MERGKQGTLFCSGASHRNRKAPAFANIYWTSNFLPMEKNYFLKAGLVFLSAIFANIVSGTISAQNEAPDTKAEPTGTPRVIITEVYGGGGNSGAPYTNDYVVLYNTTSEAVALDGWSIQYKSKAGKGAVSEGDITALSGTIQPHAYYLVQLAGGETGVALPAPDATGTSAMSSTSGKVMLCNNQTALDFGENGDISIADLWTQEQLADYVPFGKDAVPVWGSPIATNPSNTKAATRKMVNGSYAYTRNIGDDFETAAPNPKNSASEPLTALPAVTQEAQISFDGQVIRNAAGVTVNVFAINGMRMATAKTDIDMTHMPAGMYIVRTDNQAIKIIKRQD